MRISLRENLQVALTAVWTHRFRSFLTIIGIVIGITTVVTIGSLLTGLRNGIVVFFQELGPDNIFVFKTSGDPSAIQAPAKELRRRPIKPEYAEIVRNWSNFVEDAGVQLYIPRVVQNRALVARVPGFSTDSISLLGSTSNALGFAPRDLRTGRLFTPAEDRRGARVALLGASLAEALFPGGRTVGSAVQVDGAEYIVVGVFEKAKGGFFGENGLDRQVTIPLRTARLRYPQLDRFMVVFKARPGLRQEAYEEVEAGIRKVRQTPPGEENDFSLSTADQVIDQIDEITGLVIMAAIALSGLGLLVGGIGVMNIMLVSVTERTREIGLRKAVGARSLDIVAQFLMEAVTLAGVGGILGILFSVMMTMILGALLRALPSQVPVWAVVAGFSVSVLVGVFFGVWPALKAARLDPVEALRHE